MATKGLARDRKKTYIRLRKCSKCGKSGGTLVKVGDHYEHQDKGKCAVMKFRSKK